MTKRERYLRALRNEAVDELVWGPNFDYWLHVNRAAGTLPPRYREMSRNDIVRAIGGYIWNRTSGHRQVVDPSVRTVQERAPDGARITEYHTPVGSVRTVSRPTESEHSSWFLAEHCVKRVDDLRVMQYIAEATDYEPNYEPVHKALAETGDDGVVLVGAHCVPFIQFAKTDAGYETAFYLWTDYREPCDALINTYFRKYLES